MTEDAPLKVIIADDSPTFRAGLVSYLHQVNDISIVHQVSNGRSLLSILNEGIADIVLMDIRMPEKDGIECTKYIRANYPNIKILILSNYGELVFIRELTKTEDGAHGYLLKNAEKEEIVFAIKKICNNGFYLCDEVRDKISSLDKFDDRFSPQELQTLYYFWNGLTSEQISKKVYRSKHAVDARFKNIYAETKCSNQRELMRYIIENNLNEIFKYQFDNNTDAKDG
ncbi:MAG: response regulator transcription factor [Saprospiraceae bacterium]